jgi:antitoxin component of RelBE/YafQ-DinJ toxin-antitoxin module
MQKTITITMNDETKKRLEDLRFQFGLTKSQAISYAVNYTANEKIKREGEDNEKRA